MFNPNDISTAAGAPAAKRTRVSMPIETESAASHSHTAAGAGAGDTDDILATLRAEAWDGTAEPAGDFSDIYAAWSGTAAGEPDSTFAVRAPAATIAGSLAGRKRRRTPQVNIPSNEIASEATTSASVQPAPSSETEELTAFFARFNLKDIKKKLKDFDSYAITLKAIGYTAKQIFTFATTIKPASAFKSFVDLHDILTKEIYQFTHAQLIRITTCEHNLENLKAIKTHFPSLKEMGFTGEDIIKIVTIEKGAAKLGLVHEHFATLKAIGFRGEDTANILVAHPRINLNLLTKHSQALHNLGFACSDIISMAQQNGTKKLELAYNHYQVLKGSEFKEDIIKKVLDDIASKSLPEAEHIAATYKGTNCWLASTVVKAAVPATVSAPAP